MIVSRQVEQADPLCEEWTNQRQKPGILLISDDIWMFSRSHIIWHVLTRRDRAVPFQKWNMNTYFGLNLPFLYLSNVVKVTDWMRQIDCARSMSTAS